VQLFALMVRRGLGLRSYNQPENDHDDHSCNRRRNTALELAESTGSSAQKVFLFRLLLTFRPDAFGHLKRYGHWIRYLSGGTSFPLISRRPHGLFDAGRA